MKTAILLVLAVALSLWTHSIVFSQWMMPTYGNTMIHVANARNLVENGFYSVENDYSYGGGVPNIYVPVYRFFLAETVSLTGWNFDFASRMMVMLIAVLLPLGFFLLARELFGELAGIAAAFLASLPAELLIYTVRPLPQALGLALLPIALYCILKERRALALLFAVATVLTHQEAGVFFVGACFAYFAVEAAHSFWVREKISSRAWLSLGCWLAGTVSYLSWHYFTSGDWNILNLAQFKNHEGAVVTFQALYDKTGLVVLALGVIGLLFLLYTIFKNRKASWQELFALALLGVGLFVIKNDLVGLRVFMDRFIVYFQYPLVVLASLAFARAYEKACVKNALGGGV